MDSNLQRHEFPDLGIDILSEIQSVPLRIYEHKGKEVIGVCLVEAAGVNQSTVKLLHVDSSKRAEHFKNIHAALQRIGPIFGFKERLHQRLKAGRFLTFFKKILRK